MNSFGESVDWQGKPIAPEFKQAMVGYTVDSFIKQFNPAAPTHIKIDVDGLERLIIHGAKETLADKGVKSLLVELDTESKHYSEVLGAIETSGLKLEKKVQAKELGSTRFSKVFNHIFKR